MYNVKANYLYYILTEELEIVGTHSSLSIKLIIVNDKLYLNIHAGIGN